MPSGTIKSTAEPAAQGWSPRVRAVVSLLVALHVTAVFVAPWSLDGSPLPGMMRLALGPYIQAAFLDHGYEFFAPEPGPSHIIYYDVARADGSHATGRFPTLAEHRPRLLYHRHFMMSEFLNIFARPGPEGQRHPVFESYSRSYARHLVERHQGQEVELRLVRHWIPNPDEVAGGLRLDDAKLYEDLLTVRFTKDEL